MKPETDEQRKWFLLGALYIKIQEFAEEFNLTFEQAQQEFYDMLSGEEEKK
jgi:hypothetical protein